MPSGDSKNKVEIEVAIRDMFSTTLKTMGKELDALNKRAAETGVGGAGGFDKFRRSSDALAESTKRSNAQFTVMSGITSTLTKGLLGTVGLAAGFYAVAKSLEDVAVGSARLKNFSTDTGLAVSKIQDLQQTLRRGGFSKSEGDSVIGALGSMGNNLAAFKESSDIYQKLIQAPGGAALAVNLLNIAKTGDNAKVVSEYLKSFNQQTREAKFFMAEAVGSTVSALQRMADQADKNRNVKLWPIDEKEAQKYLDWWVDAETRFDNIWTSIRNHGIKTINELSETLASEGITSRGVADFINRDTDQFVAKMKATIEELKAIKQWYDNLVSTNDLPAATEAIIGKKPGDFLRGGRPAGSFPQGEDPMGKDYTARSISSYFGKRSDAGGATDFSGRAKDDGVNILTDIRDTLQRIELGGSDGGSGGGTASGGISGGTGSYGTGARGAGSGALKGGLGGFRPGGGGTRADRNNNPGNIEFGEFAKAQGATGSDGRFAIFPDRETGFKAAENLLGGKGYAGKTLAEIGQRWSGDPKWAGNVSKATGIPTDAVPNEEQRSQIARLGMPRAEGSLYGGAGSTGIGAGGGVPSAILTKAREVVLRGGGSAGAQAYIRSQGFNVDSAWCGDFAAAVVRGSGGTPPKNYQVASNWRNFGNPVDGPPQPGDIGVRKGARTGATGSHVNIVDSYDPNTGQFTGIGGNQGRMRAEYPASRYDFRRGDANRETVDKAQSGGGDKWGRIGAKVEFLNQPPGVKTSAEAEGNVFKDLQISTTKQGGVYRQDGQAYD